jgi:hypothetical protein
VTVSGGLELQEVVRARDGTRKLIFKLMGGEAAGGSKRRKRVQVVGCLGYS